MCAGACALPVLVYLGGGLMMMIVGTCDDGMCSTSSCWWGCECRSCPLGYNCTTEDAEWQSARDYWVLCPLNEDDLNEQLAQRAHQCVYLVIIPSFT